jgi:hypothetical protein
MAVHHSVAAAVDALLRGRTPQPEIRYVDDGGQLRIEKAPAPAPEPRSAGNGGGMGRLPFEKHAESLSFEDRPRRGGFREPAGSAFESAQPAQPSRQHNTLRVYPYGVGRGRLIQASQNLGVPVSVVDDLEHANAVVTLKNYYRKHPQPITEAERRRIPVYVLRSNTINQMEAILGDIFNVPVIYEDPMEKAVQETQEAIRRVLSGSSSEELPPAGPDVRRMQHEMARSANLVSHSYGSEPRRRVRIFQG